jgi:hypothetical protein
MREFRMLVNDDRPGRSDFRWVQTSTEMRARDIAEQAFRETPHHIGVELWEADELIFVVGARTARTSRPLRATDR